MFVVDLTRMIPMKSTESATFATRGLGKVAGGDVGAHAAAAPAETWTQRPAAPPLRFPGDPPVTLGKP